MKKNKTIRKKPALSITIDNDVNDALNSYCDNSKFNKSYVINKIIKKHFNISISELDISNNTMYDKCMTIIDELNMNIEKVSHECNINYDKCITYVDNKIETINSGFNTIINEEEMEKIKKRCCMLEEKNKKIKEQLINKTEEIDEINEKAEKTSGIIMNLFKMNRKELEKSARNRKIDKISKRSKDELLFLTRFKVLEELYDSFFIEE